MQENLGDEVAHGNVRLSGIRGPNSSNEWSSCLREPEDSRGLIK